MAKKSSKKKPITKTFTFAGKRYYVRGKTEKEVTEKIALKRDALESGRVIVESSMTLDEWANICFEKYKPRQKENTKRNFRDKYRCGIGNFIGQMPLKSIKPIHCQDVLIARSHLSQNQIDMAYQIMKFIFRKAVENGLINKDPTVSLEKPRGYVEERRSLTAREQQAAMEIFAETNEFLLFELMLKCGCRPSEASEVKGGDAHRVDGYPVLHIRGTKSPRADRNVPCPDDLFRKIMDTDPFSYVTVHNAGGKHTPTSRKNLWVRFKKAMDIKMGARVEKIRKLSRDGKYHPVDVIVGPRLFTDVVPYCLRHTYCVNLVLSGMDMVTTMFLMGHESTDMVAKVYSHYTDDVLIRAARTLNMDSSDQEEIIEDEERKIIQIV